MSIFKLAGPSTLAGLMLFVSSSFGMADDWLATLQTIEKETAGRIGVAMVDQASERSWHFNAQQRFPLNSTFKSFACAALLSKEESGEFNLTSTKTIAQQDLVTWSPVTKKHIGKALSYDRLCEAAITLSDNTAANAILEALGGPSGFTQFMRSIGDKATRIDRMEPDLNEGLPGDVRDTTTPIAAIQSLESLLLGSVLKSQSRQRLMQWMIDDKVADSLVRSVLPEGWKIADKSGAGGHGSRGIIAILWPQPDKPVFLAIYLTETNLPFKARNATIAKISKVLIGELGAL